MIIPSRMSPQGEEEDRHLRHQAGQHTEPEIEQDPEDEEWRRDLHREAKPARRACTPSAAASPGEGNPPGGSKS